MTALQMIGGGRMGQALIGGLIDAGWAPASELAVVEVVPEQRVALSARWPEVAVIDRPMPGVDAVLAVKPPMVIDVCRDLSTPGRILSIAAGVTIEAMEAALPDGTTVIRAMPNTPALVGAGAAGLAPGSTATEVDMAWASEVLDAVGAALPVAEAQLDAVTGLSGSGPAYVFLLAEAMTDAGVSVGLPREVAGALARQTIYGAGKLMMESEADPVELRAAVTTPAGTTAAGLEQLESGALRAIVARAVRAATDRSVELGRG